ncbi:MAG: 50S ribosomal protein L9 [Candidatus Avilachnospira sp.]|jgi:large subunit ribosomal protein L9
MQVVLLQDVKSLGKKGDVVKINDGYARNYILPKKLGVEANAANLNDLKLQKANSEKIEAAKVAEAKALSEKLGGAAVTLKIKTGEGGKTFGSVTGKEIAQAIKEELGVDIDKKRIVLPEPIKSVGTREVLIKLHKEVNANLRVKVEEA